MKKQYHIGRWAAIMAVVVLFASSFRAFAIEDAIQPFEIEKEDIISVDLPTVSMRNCTGLA